MEKSLISFDNLPLLVYNLRQEVIELKALLLKQASPTPLHRAFF